MDRVSGGGCDGRGEYAWRRGWVLVASHFFVVGLILHMPIINSNERTCAGEISGLLGWCVSYCLVLVRGGSLIADRVVVPGDFSLIVWTREAP